MDLEQIAIIRGLPMPPSVNGLYSTIGHRRVKSKKYADYEREVYRWLGTNQEQVLAARNLMRSLRPETVIHVEALFMMMFKDIVCKDGRPKRNDTSNRLKALHDVLSSIVLGVDDCLFWSGTFDKEPVQNKMDIGVTVTMTLRGIHE